MPAALYVIVAGFAGSIAASRRKSSQSTCSDLFSYRVSSISICAESDSFFSVMYWITLGNILLRFLTPVAFSAMAFGYFFPASSNRLIAQANQSDLSKYIPQDLQKQIRDLSGQVSSNTTSSSAQSTLTKAVEEVKQTAKEVKETLETKTDSAVVVAKETVEDVKEKVAELKQAVVAEVEKEKAKVEKHVEESDKEARLRKIREEDSRKRV